MGGGGGCQEMKVVFMDHLGACRCPKCRNFSLFIVIIISKSNRSNIILSLRVSVYIVC